MITLKKEKKKLVIALDIDGTYTEDIKMWDAFIKLAQSAGHNVIICTMRYHGGQYGNIESKELIEIFTDVCPIYFTGRQAKKPYMEALGINVDIWIDDTPEWILHNSK